jgi:hypothetical protein
MLVVYHAPKFPFIEQEDWVQHRAQCRYKHVDLLQLDIHTQGVPGTRVHVIKLSLGTTLILVYYV